MGHVGRGREVTTLNEDESQDEPAEDDGEAGAENEEGTGRAPQPHPYDDRGERS